MITEEQQAIFQQVLAAVTENPGGIALLETKEKGTGRSVLLVTAVIQEDEFYDMIPLAELLLPGDLKRYEEPK